MMNTRLAMLTCDNKLTSALLMVGSILLIAIGINFMEIKKIKVANMLPALLIPIIYYLVISLF